MKTRLAAAASAALFVIGALAQIWAPRIGTTLMILAVLAALAALLFMLQQLQRRLIKHERFITGLQKSVKQSSDAATRRHGQLLLEFKHVKAGLESPAKAAAAAPAAAAEPPKGSTATKPSPGGVGRAGTPEVTNPFTVETLASMLAPQRRLVIGGLFTGAELPEHTAAPWMPGDVLRSLEEQRPDLIVLDEAVLAVSPIWSSATSAVGTSLMQELVRGVTWAAGRHIPVYLLTARIGPDVHTGALRSTAAVALPLTGADRDAAAGAPQTPVLARLEKIARSREEVQA